MDQNETRMRWELAGRASVILIKYAVLWVSRTVLIAFGSLHSNDGNGNENVT